MTTLPPEIAYGKVVGRFILADADSPTDLDVLPDAVAAEGTITFTPTVPNIKVSTPRPTTVVKKSLFFDLDAEGYLVDRNGLDGVWLVTGDYTVTFQLTGIQIIPLVISVTTLHTDAAPLDLTTEIP